MSMLIKFFWTSTNKHCWPITDANLASPWLTLLLTFCGPVFVNTSILVTVGAIFFLFSLTCEATAAEWQTMIDRPARPRRTFLKASRNERNMLLRGNRVQIRVTSLACWLGLFHKWKRINKGGGNGSRKKVQKGILLLFLLVSVR